MERLASELVNLPAVRPNPNQRPSGRWQLVAGSSMAITATPSGVRIRFHVQPRSSRTELSGKHGNAFKLRLHAPPVDGAANAALLRFVADRLGVPVRAVALARGATSREKIVTVEGIAVEAARAALEN